MHHTRRLIAGAALAATSLTVAAAPSAVASASRPSVSVRIEGASKTLLAATTVAAPDGSVTHNGAPSGACSGDSAQGALQAATKGNWKGTYYAKYREYFITGILGHKPAGKAYWALYVNNVYASAGACEVKLHRGDQILFAIVPPKGTEHPIGLTTQSVAASGGKSVSVTVTVVGYTAKGKAQPLSGAKVTVGSTTMTSNVQGKVMFPTKGGKLSVTASKAGYIRDETTLTVRGS